MLTFLLPALEAITNRALRCDPDALKKLQPLKNQVIKIHCTDWRFTFFIVIDHNGLQFHSKYFSHENTLIKSTLSNFLTIFVKGADTKTLFENPMEISGNTHTLEALRDIFSNLDLDLEEKLSAVIGDVAAHKLCAHTQKIRRITAQTTQKLGDQIKEYLYFEGKYFPTQKQLEQFYQDVTTLRDDTARLEARLLRLS